MYDIKQDIDANLLFRVYGEYVEMPGLQLTVPQASRLWNVNRALSAQVLDRLVDAAFLRRTGSCYVRADSGRVRA
jgi:predicted transcriptional regulator